MAILGPSYGAYSGRSTRSSSLVRRMWNTFDRVQTGYIQRTNPWCSVRVPRTQQRSRGVKGVSRLSTARRGDGGGGGVVGESHPSLVSRSLGRRRENPSTRNRFVPDIIRIARSISNGQSITIDPTIRRPVIMSTSQTRKEEATTVVVR